MAVARRSRGAQLFRVMIGLLAVSLVGFLVADSLGWPRTNEALVNRLAVRTGELAQPQSQIGEILGDVVDMEQRWFGSPALWVPPPIANADIERFDVTGRTQRELIASLDNSAICSGQKCAPDPAVPNGVAWGLEGSRPGDAYRCYSPGSTTLIYRPFVLLPRWSPPADGTLKTALVQAWNSLLQVIYTHEAGHVAIDIQDVAALNDQAHQLRNCPELIDFWSSPSVFDKLNADQDAYHARLQADCRPEIGCMPAGWMGW